MVEILLLHGADSSTESSWSKRTPLYYAKEGDHVEVAKLLENHTKPSNEGGGG